MTDQEYSKQANAIHDAYDKLKKENGEAYNRRLNELISGRDNDIISLTAKKVAFDRASRTDVRMAV